MDTQQYSGVDRRHVALGEMPAASASGAGATAAGTCSPAPAEVGPASVGLLVTEITTMTTESQMIAAISLLSLGASIFLAFYSCSGRCSGSAMREMLLPTLAAAGFIVAAMAITGGVLGVSNPCRSWREFADAAPIALVLGAALVLTLSFTKSLWEQTRTSENERGCQLPGIESTALLLRKRRSIFPKDFSGQAPRARAPRPRPAPARAFGPCPRASHAPLALCSPSAHTLRAQLVPRAVVDKCLEAANWAPTHGKTEPWRFVIFEGPDGLARFDAIKASAIRAHFAHDEGAREAALRKMESKAPQMSKASHDLGAISARSRHFVDIFYRSPPQARVTCRPHPCPDVERQRPLTR